VPDLSPWPATYREAVVWQELWRRLVVLAPLGAPPGWVAGVDAAYDHKTGQVFGAAALYTFPDLKAAGEAGARGPCLFPYIPGLLSFRETPVLLKALGNLPRRPDLVLADGQGIAHPRGLGLASHLGLLLGLPVIGVAKSRLVGEGGEPGRAAGSSSPLRFAGREVGMLLRTQPGRKPLYVSPGHLVSLEDCRNIVLGCVTRYRLPLPLRHADLLSRRFRRNPSALLETATSRRDRHRPKKAFADR
jgi:deoxyribonuclease V